MSVRVWGGKDGGIWSPAGRKLGFLYDEYFSFMLSFECFFLLGYLLTRVFSLCHPLTSGARSGEPVTVKPLCHWIPDRVGNDKKRGGKSRMTGEGRLLKGLRQSGNNVSGFQIPLRLSGMTKGREGGC